jgi:hypothetical protein
MTLVLAGACLLFAGRAQAQIGGHRNLNRAIGFGVGLDRVEDQGTMYVSGSFRFNWWDDEDEDLQRTLASRSRSRMKGFLEAEVGYWKESELTPFESDLLIGINVIGVLPTRAVDLFFGGGVGMHFLRESASLEGEESVGNDQRFGANIQFGVDLNFSDPVGIFALGRYDILQGDTLDFQSKIQTGIRFRF